MEKPSAHQERIAQLLGKSKAQPLAEIQLERMDVILSGHFQLREHRHSTKYIRFRPEFYSSEIGLTILGSFLDQLRSAGKINFDAVEAVAGPETGGAFFAERLAQLLDDEARTTKRSSVIAVKVKKTRGSEWGYRLDEADARAIEGRRTLVCDDVWNTGLTLAGVVIPTLRYAKARIVGAVVLANRGNASMPPLCPFDEYWKISDDDCFSLQNCPMCKAGEPITQF